LEWLLSGENPVYKSEESSGGVDPKLIKMVALFEELTPDQQREISAVAEEKKRINVLEKAVREMQLDKKA